MTSSGVTSTAAHGLATLWKVSVYQIRMLSEQTSERTAFKHAQPPLGGDVLVFQKSACLGSKQAIRHYRASR
jgi:hypothetical protein